MSISDEPSPLPSYIALDKAEDARAKCYSVGQGTVQGTGLFLVGTENSRGAGVPPLPGARGGSPYLSVQALTFILRAEGYREAV